MKKIKAKRGKAIDCDLVNKILCEERKKERRLMHTADRMLPLSSLQIRYIK
jgi:hypothetical protein